MGQTILETERRVSGDDGVIFTVMTDGYENASQEFTAEQVRRLIERLKSAGWKFMFLGADIDAYAASGRLGFAQSDSVSMDKGRMRAAFSTSRRKAFDYDTVRREAGAREAAERTGYTEQDRLNLGDDDRNDG